MRQPQELRGLYAITDATTDLVAKVAAAIQGGARLIQYRDKTSGTATRLRLASQLLDLCRSHQIPLIINDDLDLAAEIHAHGIHLGRDDADIQTARSRLGNHAIIGVSCYNQLDLAIRAQEQGADYVAFGSFFPSPTKPNAIRADTSLLAQARQSIRLPIVAIGGITPENASGLIQAGADMLAVVSGLFQGSDTMQASRNYADLFKQIIIHP